MPIFGVGLCFMMGSQFELGVPGDLLLVPSGLGVLGDDT